MVLQQGSFRTRAAGEGTVLKVVEWAQAAVSTTPRSLDLSALL